MPKRVMIRKRSWRRPGKLEQDRMEVLAECQEEEADEEASVFLLIPAVAEEETAPGEVPAAQVSAVTSANPLKRFGNLFAPIYRKPSS
jgi:hypothetical protein